MCSLSLYQCAVRQYFEILRGLSIVSKELISHDTDNSVFSRKENTDSSHESSFFLVTHDASRYIIFFCPTWMQNTLQQHSTPTKN